ncbi:MAG: DUF2442 domain-containing protein [Clostridia bacterium]|nr:DUF2442 domain-containing protein [Clostridia bacterium]
MRYSMKKIVNVYPLDNYEILVEFEGGEKRIKDMKPYLNKGVFSKLNDKEFFKSVKVVFDSVSWNDEIDMCADSIYESSTEYKQ